MFFFVVVVFFLDFAKRDIESRDTKGEKNQRERERVEGGRIVDSVYQRHTTFGGVTPGSIPSEGIEILLLNEGTKRRL